jgi:hypothetical protein
MAEFSFRLLRPLLVAVVGVAGLGGPVLGQDTAPSTVTNPYTVSVVSAPSPYWGYSSNPYGGYLHGVADVTRAQGQWLLYQQEAIRLREKNRQEKVVSRRMEIEHWVWEREFLAEARKRERERIREEERERSRTTPPLTEILSAYSLNFLLHELKQNPGLAAAGSTPVEAEWLDHVHVTYVTTGAGGNVGLLKGNRIPWGVLLRGKDYQADREEVERLVAQAKKEVRAGGASAETIRGTAALDAAVRAERPQERPPMALLCILDLSGTWSTWWKKARDRLPTIRPRTPSTGARPSRSGTSWCRPVPCPVRRDGDREGTRGRPGSSGPSPNDRLQKVRGKEKKYQAKPVRRGRMTTGRSPFLSRYWEDIPCCFSSRRAAAVSR